MDLLLLEPAHLPLLRHERGPVGVSLQLYCSFVGVPLTALGRVPVLYARMLFHIVECLVPLTGGQL